MHKTHIFDQKNNEEKIENFTDLPTLIFFKTFTKEISWPDVCLQRMYFLCQLGSFESCGGGGGGGGGGGHRRGRDMINSWYL